MATALPAPALFVAPHILSLSGSAQSSPDPAVGTGDLEWSIGTLTTGVRHGREAAVRALYARYRERLTRYCLVVAHGDETAASDAVQAAFLKAVRCLRPMEDESALWAWLARAARSSMADASRSHRRYGAVLQKFAALFDGPAEPPADTELIWHEALESALAGLDEDSKGLIEARYFERRSLADVALEQNTTDRAVESRLARIREKLRQSVLQQLASRRHET